MRDLNLAHDFGQLCVIFVKARPKARPPPPPPGPGLQRRVSGAWQPAGAADLESDDEDGTEPAAAAAGFQKKARKAKGAKKRKAPTKKVVAAKEGVAKKARGGGGQGRGGGGQGKWRHVNGRKARPRVRLHRGIQRSHNRLRCGRLCRNVVYMSCRKNGRG
jgi:hypothetical protein